MVSTCMLRNGASPVEGEGARASSGRHVREMTDHQMLDAQMERAAREHPAAHLWGNGAVVSTCMLRGGRDGGEPIDDEITEIIE